MTHLTTPEASVAAEWQCTHPWVWTMLEMAAPDARIIDAGGATVLPGFVESHLHLVLGGAELAHLHLTGIDGAGPLAAAFRDFAAKHPDRPLLMGQGGHYAMLDHPMTRHDLDAIIADRPIAITAHDHHTVWANTAALTAAETGHLVFGTLHTIGAADTAETVHDRLAALGAEAIAEALDRIETLRPDVQPEDGVTYAAKIDKAEAAIDWTRDAVDIDRTIRGLSPFPGAWTMAAGPT